MATHKEAMANIAGMWIVGGLVLLALPFVMAIALAVLFLITSPFTLLSIGVNPGVMCAFAGLITGSILIYVMQRVGL